MSIQSFFEISGQTTTIKGRFMVVEKPPFNGGRLTTTYMKHSRHSLETTRTTEFETGETGSFSGSFRPIETTAPLRGSGLRQDHREEKATTKTAKSKATTKTPRRDRFHSRLSCRLSSTMAPPYGPPSPKGLRRKETARWRVSTVQRALCRPLDNSRKPMRVVAARSISKGGDDQAK